MTKVVTIVIIRPEIIKLSRVIPELEKYAVHVLFTNKNYDCYTNEIFSRSRYQKTGLFSNAVGGSTAQTIGNIISESDKALEKKNRMQF